MRIRSLRASQLDPPPEVVRAITQWATDQHLRKAGAFLYQRVRRDYDWEAVRRFTSKPSQEAWEAILAAPIGRDLQWKGRYNFSDPESWKGLKFKNFLRAAQAELDSSKAQDDAAQEENDRQWREWRGLLHNPSTKPALREQVDQELEETFTVDLTGWRYADRLPRGLTIPPLKAKIRDLPPSVAAAFGNWTLSLPLLSTEAYRDLNKLSGYLTGRLRQNIYHECQHLSQALFELAAKGQGGMPSRRLQTPQWQQHQKHDRLDATALHSLDDAEFYPVLQSAIHGLQRVLSPLTAPQRKEFLQKVLVGQDPVWQRGSWSRDLVNELDYAWKFFQALRQHAPQKHRKAAGELIKALL